MLPASAGMILVNMVVVSYIMSAPRIRGDDPHAAGSIRDDLRCSPHPRG